MPTYVVVRPRDERQGVSVHWWMRNLVHTLDYAGMVTACERRHPAQGTLTLMARVPETCRLGDEPTEPPITLRFGGELMNSALADCLKVTLDRALARLEPPACTHAWLHEWRLDFPHPALEIEGLEEQ